MSISKVTCKFFRLTDGNITSLKDVQDRILNKIYTEKLNIAKKDIKLAETLTENEKSFYYTWEEISELNKIELNKACEESDEAICEFLFATANIEYTKKKKKGTDGKFLPKKERVNYTQAKTYFFCMNEAIYTIICSSNETCIERVKKLIGINYIDEKNEAYSIQPDLFNWLFFKYTQNKGSLTNELILMNINGFIGNIGDEHNIFEGTSDQTSELIITKAFISNGETLKTITARLKNEDIDIIFAVDERSNTQIYTRQSEVLRLLEFQDDETFFVIYLYSKLIPELKTLYNSASSQFLSEEKRQFSEKIGLEVIESIIKQNSLTLKDISLLFENSIQMQQVDNIS
ncbi:hypothetical protein NLY50_17230 [Bacillus sp. RP12]|uniref:hypothetical protein n=1 Tax=Bacillus TaxID=1386 RepID=UPI001B83BFAD|nr:MULTISPECIES: hypothetical protein [Bacillus]MBR0622135.1 hypothetical protein [Bacillus pumilus]MCW6700281.1 hypothetical protein [Bacillus sp. RP12]